MPMSSSSPNVLILMTDQHRWDYLGCVTPSVPTPNLDRLAKRGTRFSEAVCPAPMCIPSRYATFLGLYPSQLGTRNNSQTLQNHAHFPVPTLFERFRDAGYHTIGSGKTHWVQPPNPAHGIPPPTSTSYGFDQRFIARMAGGYDSEPGAVCMGDPGQLPDEIEAIRALNQRCGYGGEGPPGYVGGVLPGDGATLREAWSTDRFLEALEARPRHQPWLGYLSFDAPHAPLFAPEEWIDRIDPAALPFPPQLPLPDADHFPPLAHTREAYEAWRTLSPAQQRESLCRYAALCAYADAQFGRVLDWLERNAQINNTLVVFLSDHGESLGDRNRFSKYSLYEASVRVPLILAGPGIQENVVDPRPANLVDLMPTLLSACRLETPGILPGENLLAPPIRSGALCELHGNGMWPQPAPSLMWRTPEWKIILSGQGTWLEDRLGQTTPVRELYHLSSDPQETRNLYRDPAHAEMRAALLAEALQHLLRNMAVWPGSG
ncbi:MAG: sulfatase-like hydrolase/transferase [Verrucomicrobia bacterium]|nr:sulfatase-like hydrolase/transferase [Verrucomicrobiota bacterium]